MSAGYFPKREKIGLEDLFQGLVTASHILHHHDVLDAYGHISVRSPDNAATFWMPCNMAPALLSTPDDLVEYKVADASAVEREAKAGYIERYIHSEIYKKFPTVNSVVHSHSSHVLPYCISSVPLRATVHMAGFLGNNTPVWDISSAYPTSISTSTSSITTSSSSSAGVKRDSLVRDAQLGASLAAAFKPATSAGFLYSKVRSALPSQMGGSREPDT